jgi:hypothetical protein
MSSASSTTAPRHTRAPRLAPARRAAGAVAIAALLTVGGTADAQPTRPAPRTGFELLASSGAFVPIGTQRGALKDAPISTAQLSYVVRSRFAVTTAVGWARSRDLVAEGDPKLSVFTYDVGVEARAPHWLSGDAGTLTPFVGVGGRGVGATTIAAGTSTRRTASPATPPPARSSAWGACGCVWKRATTSAASGRSSTGGEAVARNDVMIMAGLRLTRRRG